MLQYADIVEQKLTQQPEWREYQKNVATFLSQLGFTTNIDEKIHGARGKHAVDVTARMAIAGVAQLWLIECKKWRRPVPKERVLTFTEVVKDTGADRGLMFAESGFQSGAVRASGNTNITLTSLADFQENSADELISLRAKVLDEKVVALGQKFLAIWDLSDVDRNKVLARYTGPPNPLGLEGCTTVTAHLSVLRDSLEHARFRRWPVNYFALDDDLPILVQDWEGLFFVVEETISTCERIYEHMMGAGDSISHWKELQSPKLAELLDLIRKPK